MIKYTSLGKLRILDFFQVTTNIAAHLGKYDLNKLNIGNPATAFRDALDMLDDSLRPLRASAETQKLKELDSRRDDALIGFAAFLKSFERSPNTAKRAAAAALVAHLEKYGKSPQSLPLREQTAMITNLVQDLLAPESTQRLALLGGQDWADELRDTNTAFEAAYNSRTQENALKETGKIKAARLETQEKLSHLIEVINARLVLEETTPEYRAIAEEIDTEIRQAKMLYKTRTAQRKDDAPQI